jgi:Tfp pilus assembly protein PilF
MTNNSPPAGSPSPWRTRCLPALLLVAAIFLAYIRVWHAGFIWDDDDHLTRNPCIIGPLGFPAIWTSARAVYYPLVLTSFWIEHQLWALNPLPYHLVNIALHAACALLLWAVLRRLSIPGAWLGAALWALHPVQVETAAWITEQKNTQSCLFYLLSILLFIRWHKSRPAANPLHYTLALICALLAILSKSSTVMLPVILGLCCWWIDSRWRWRNLPALIPFLAVSFAASLWTIWEQKYANHALGPEWSQTWPQRFVIAGKDIWFYLAKLAWPHPLTFIYPRWSLDTSHLTSWLPLLAITSIMLILWLLRDGPLRPVFFAAAYFIISLFPVLSFFNVYFYRYSFVGDHFQYLASIAPLALAATTITWLCNSPAAKPLLPIISATLILTYSTLTYLQSAAYYNLESLWRATLADNPNAFLAQYNLAGVLVQQGHLDEAIQHYRQNLLLQPDNPETLGNLANVLSMQGNLHDAIPTYQHLLTIDPTNIPALSNLASTYARAHLYPQAIATQKQAITQATAISDTKDLPILTHYLNIYETQARP